MQKIKTEKIKPTKATKVLIALDYDKSSGKVAQTGYDMAKAMNAEVTLLHVISDPVYYSSTEYSPILGLTGSLGVEPSIAESIDRLKEVTQNFLADEKNRLGDEKIQILLKEGDFADTILKTAKKLHASVIVIGSHSSRWLEDIVMGSVTNKVLRNTTIPLFIVPTKKHD
jgi:nucleotide-binding universal stress UspA family protein